MNTPMCSTMKFKRLLDDAAPTRTAVKRTAVNDCRWISDEARAAKWNCLRLERLYFQTHNDANRRAYRTAQLVAKQAVTDSLTAHLKTCLSDVASNPKQTWNVMMDLLHEDKKEITGGCNTSELADTIIDFFQTKLLRIRNMIALMLTTARSIMFRQLCVHTGPIFVSNGCNNSDLIIDRTSSASFSNDDWIRHSSHQDKIWRQSFLCCRTARVECSSSRYKEHYRLVILQTSHQDTFLYWHILIKQFSRLYYVRRFWTIFRG